MEILIIIILIVVGLILFGAEIFLLPGFGIAGILSAVSLLYAVYYAFATLAMSGGFITLFVTLLGIIGIIIWFMRSKTMDRLSLKKELDYTFYKRISDVANRLFLMGILYDFKLYPDRALISFSNDEYGDSDEKIRHIEIVNGNQEDKIYDDSLLINSDYLKKLSEPLLPENWERITEEVSANEFPGLVPYYNYGAYDDGQETLENCNEGFVYRPTDEVTEFIMEIIERLRNEDIIIGTEKQQKFVNKLNKIVKLESDKGIVAFFRILRKIFPAIISEQYTTFSKILELAVRNSEPIHKDRLKSVQ